MQNIVLVILLILALSLIVTVLMQRSEGGGLGIGGGGGNMSGRPPATPAAKFTWILGAGFMAASLALTIIAAREDGNNSLLNGDLTAPAVSQSEDSTTPLGGNLLPPSATDGPATPPKAED
ncbi:preprotein translocase subunit SecG [Neptunicoccus cionae]|uniref:preprotein translocase subunit SecG n=1 Tax=Neptunicoccus cionae TaxID=2035344 RepID=UPI000C75D0B2|nr:preprotein translocase subunit SecG [Amylibacter cionae]PLS21992.1 preprotein translocase subunit SecG [Amylibacter cionae]